MPTFVKLTTVTRLHLTGSASVRSRSQLSPGPDWIIAVPIYGTDLIDVEGPALRIAPKTFKLLRLTSYGPTVFQVFTIGSHFLPFSTIRCCFFLSTYWPLGKLGASEVVLVSIE